MTLIIHGMLRNTRQVNTMQQKDKATQHSSPKAVIFKEKIGWDSNPQQSHSLASAPLTEKPVEWVKQSQAMCEVCPPGIVYCIYNYFCSNNNIMLFW